jgi:5-methylcytosine-specific restriction enzyme subunit McrC
LYQIFTYVKNRAAKGGEVAGMLLYAKTDEEIYPDNEYKMSGNKVTVRTLDLNRDFEAIASQLDAIVQKHFAL